MTGSGYPAYNWLYVDNACYASWNGTIFQNFTTDGQTATYCAAAYAAAGAYSVILYLYDENSNDAVDVYWYNY